MRVSGLERDDLDAQLGRETCLAQQAELAPASVKVPSLRGKRPAPDR